MRQICGLDVHKDSVFACILNENGVIFQDKYGVLTPELEQLASKLQEYDVGEVCMESTSIYWMPVWRVLEPYVSELKLVNPHFIKQLPGFIERVKKNPLAVAVKINALSDKLTRMWSEGMSVNDIADHFGRKNSAIITRLKKLGI